LALSVLNKIAFYQNKRDEVPNQQLARELAETEMTTAQQARLRKTTKNMQVIHDGSIRHGSQSIRIALFRVATYFLYKSFALSYEKQGYNLPSYRKALSWKLSRGKQCSLAVLVDSNHCEPSETRLRYHNTPADWHDVDSHVSRNRLGNMLVGNVQTHTIVYLLYL
jgi:hypothetical protein